ncbi:hypothetical protein [Staphylococcus aureus]
MDFQNYREVEPPARSPSILVAFDFFDPGVFTIFRLSIYFLFL